ncbi:TAXI family TRAP transporter solute-binding subunit [Desulfovibrio sp. OttesenSCG-928-I05]|nr:TAXI family TRAP transporter solute-binding subunit [Desulfovibrio sp. OttesenSCG-928-I05]
MKRFLLRIPAFLAVLFLCTGIVGVAAVPFAPVAKAAEDPAVPQRGGWPTHLRLLTGPNGGQWFMMGEPLAQVLTTNVLSTTSRMGGGVDNIATVNKKLGDLGFTLTCFMGAANSGEKEYEFIDLSNATIMTNVYPQVLYFLLRKDVADQYGIDSVEKLLDLNAPLRFASLRPGTASEFILGLLLRYGYDKSFESLRDQGWKVFFNNYAETADSLVEGELDCFAYTAGTTVPLILTMEEHAEVVVLPIDQKVLDLLSEKFGTHTYTIPTGVYKSVTKPVTTLGDYTCFVIRKDLPDDLVYAINKALWENKDQVSSVIKDFGALSPDTALPAGLPVHPGAKAFWTGLKK